MQAALCGYQSHELDFLLTYNFCSKIQLVYNSLSSSSLLLFLSYTSLSSWCQRRCHRYCYHLSCVLVVTKALSLVCIVAMSCLQASCLVVSSTHGLTLLGVKIIQHNILMPGECICVYCDNFAGTPDIDPAWQREGYPYCYSFYTIALHTI